MVVGLIRMLNLCRLVWLLPPQLRGASRLCQGARVCTGVMGWDVLSWIWEVREEWEGKEFSEAPGTSLFVLEYW